MTARPVSSNKNTFLTNVNHIPNSVRNRTTRSHMNPNSKSKRKKGKFSNEIISTKLRENKGDMSFRAHKEPSSFLKISQKAMKKE